MGQKAIVSADMRGLEPAYKQLRPVMLRALAALARNGFVVPATDALDLIHDFFIDEWLQVKANYDPRKGALEGYVYVAFVHYARPQIVRLKRSRNALVDPAWFADVESPGSMGREAIPVADLDKWCEAMGRLAAPDRQFLLRFLHEERGSERSLARKLGVSRHAAREQLIRVLGEAVTNFGRPTGTGHQDWQVAQALWGEKRTVQETASLFRLTAEQVKRAHARNVRIMVNALRRFEVRSGGEMNNMSDENNVVRTAMTPEKLLYAVMTSPGDDKLLDQLRARAVEILEAIDLQDVALTQSAAEGLDESWVAKVYEALAGSGPTLTPEDKSIAGALFNASASDVESIGTAFKETLLPDLPVQLMQFERWFESVPPVPVETIGALSVLPDVKAAFPVSSQLIVYGVTPSTIFYASEAIAATVDRLFRARFLSEKDGVVLSADKPLVVTIEGKSEEIAVNDEIARMAECELVVARALRRWLLHVAEYKAQLFGGFESEPVSQGVLLRRATKSFEGISLYRRWGLVLDTA
jgi:hypothetical protein